MPGAELAASWADFEKGRKSFRATRPRQPWPLIADLQPHAARARLDDDADPLVVAAGGVLAGVVDEIEEDLLDDRRIRPHHRGQGLVRGLDQQLHAGLAGPVGKPIAAGQQRATLTGSMPLTRRRSSRAKASTFSTRWLSREASDRKVLR